MGIFGNEEFGGMDRTQDTGSQQVGENGSFSKLASLMSPSECLGTSTVYIELRGLQKRGVLRAIGEESVPVYVLPDSQEVLSFWTHVEI